MNQMATTGSMLATRVSLMFAAQAGLAADDHSAAQIKFDDNSCKSLSSCKSASSCKSHSSCKSISSCKSHSSCKSKGWVLAS